MFDSTSIEHRAALRTSVAALAAIMIAFALHLDTPYWAGMTVVVVANLYTGSILDKAMMRIMGTVAGAILGFYLAGLVVNSLLLYFLSCFLVIALSVYYYNLSTYGYAYLLGALCVFLVIAQLAMNPQNAFFVAIWRPVEIALGVVVSAISAYLVFPNHLKSNVESEFAALVDAFVQQNAQLFEALEQDSSPFDAILTSNLALKRRIRKSVELLGALRREAGVSQEYLDEWRLFLDTLFQLARQTQWLLLFRSEHPMNGIKSALFPALEHDFQAIKAAFREHQPLEIPLEFPTAFLVYATNAPPNDELSHALNDYLSQLQRSLETFTLLLTHQTASLPQKRATISREDRLQGDVDLVKHSIKAGLAVILSLMFWMVSNWPGGLNGIISSLLISIRKNLYEMQNISLHRVAGCVIGGGIALIALAVIEMNLYDLCVLLFVCVWAFSYFMFKMPHYAYVGLQANIALIITLAQQGGPPVLLDPPLQRLGGIFIGIAASFIVANLIWRPDVKTILNRYLSKLERYIHYNAHQLLQVPQTQQKLHDLSSLFWNTRGLIESLSDAKKGQLEEFTHRFEQLVLIQAILSHINFNTNRAAAHALAEQNQWPLSMVEHQVLQLIEEGRCDDKSYIEQTIETMKSALQNLDINADEKRAVLGYFLSLGQLGRV